MIKTKCEQPINIELNIELILPLRISILAKESGALVDHQCVKGTVKEMVMKWQQT